MSVAETKLGGEGGSPSSPAAGAGRPRRRSKWVWLVGAVVVALAILGVLLGKAAVYQPIGPGRPRIGRAVSGYAARRRHQGSE